MKNRRTKDLQGRYFGELVVLNYSHSKNGAYWECKCSCGVVSAIPAAKLLSGKKKSCGHIDRMHKTSTAKEILERKTKKSNGCWLWTGNKNKQGYGYMGRSHAGTGLAHRVAFKEAYGTLPKDKEVCHHCDNPTCVRPDHLFLGTRSDNMKDAARKGRLAGQKRATLARAAAILEGR